VRVALGGGSEHIEIVRRLNDAIESGDEAKCRTLFHEDIEYILVSQASYSGLEEVVANALVQSQRVRVTQDLYTADGSGRVWWRYTARWADAVSGRPRRTTGASVAHIEGGKVKSLMSWIDVIAAGVDD
jgi:ketosteroid isomerase-like protein